MMLGMVVAEADKKEVREAVRKTRDSMTTAEVEQKSAAIAERLLQLREYTDAKTVLFYAAKGNEVQTKKLVDDALKSGKKVLLPITNTAAGELEVAEIRDYISDLKPGAFGIMEPKRKSAVDEEEIDVVIVPGVAFDKNGHRLGYGLGYYDKLLRRLTNAVKIGLACDFQVVEKLPRESHDHPMDVIVTESRVIRCS